MSLGAVFALFAAFYYWYSILLGTYNEQYGFLHFLITFIGVNMTFFPMHFLGLAGQPRRIPDYPDQYAFWNFIASFGSLITAVGVIFLIYLIIDSRYQYHLRHYKKL